MSNFDRINELKKITFISKDTIVTVDDLFLKDEDNQTYLDFIIKKNISIDNPTLIEELSKNIDLLFYMFEHKYFINKLPDIDLFFVERNGKTLIEIIFEKNSYLFNRVPLDVINKLFERVNGKCYIDEFIKENPYSCANILERMEDFETLYQHLSSTNNFELLKNCKKSFLLKITPNGVPLAEELINKKITLNLNFDETDYQLAEFFWQKQFYNELLKMDVDLLLNHPSSQNNYLSLLVQKYQAGEKIPFHLYRLKSDNNKSLAMAYIFLLKNNIPIMLPYEYNIISDFSFNGNKPPLIHMLEMDKDLTLQYFNTEENRKKLVVFLKNYGLIPKDKELVFNSIGEALDYIPTKEKLRRRIENKEITSIDKKDLFTDDLVEPMEDGLTIIDLLIQNGLKYTVSFNASLKEYIIALKYRKNIFTIDEKYLYIDIGENKKIIDLLYERKLFACIEVSIKKDLRILDYCKKYNDFSFLPSSIFEILFNNQNGKFPAEKYLNDDGFINAASKYTELSLKTKMTLYKKGYKKIMTIGSEKDLLTKINGKTILEDLLDENLSPIFPGYDVESDEICQILLNRGRIDLLYKLSLSKLINQPSKENCYLQLMIDAYKKGQNVNFEKKQYHSPRSEEDIARLYILMAKNGLDGFLGRLDEDDLLHKDSTGKNLLYYLITIDKEIALGKLIRINSLKDSNIFTELRLLGINNGLLDLSFDQFDCDAIYRQIYNEEFDKGVTCPVEDLLKELRELFVKDGKTDIKLVDALISAYRYSTSINPAFIEELVELVNIKKKNPDFYYIREPKTGFFSAGSVKVENETISTLVHETGHAMHSYLTDFEIPADFSETLARINADPTWLKRVDSYSKQFHNLKKAVHNKAVEIVFHYITPEKAN